MFDASSFCLLHAFFHPFLKICLRVCRSISFMAGYKPNKAKHQLAVHAIFVDWEEAYQFWFITWYNHYCVPLCVAQKHISWPIKFYMTFLVFHKIRAAPLKFFCYFHASSKGLSVPYWKMTKRLGNSKQFASVCSQAHMLIYLANITFLCKGKSKKQYSSYLPNLCFCTSKSANIKLVGCFDITIFLLSLIMLLF